MNKIQKITFICLFIAILVNSFESRNILRTDKKQEKNVIRDWFFGSIAAKKVTAAKAVFEKIRKKTKYDTQNQLIRNLADRIMILYG